MSVIIAFISYGMGLLSIVLVLGIIWHTRKMFDLSYKFFLISALAMTSSSLLDIIRVLGVEAPAIVETLFRLVIVLFFTLGVFEMRRLVERLAKEKEAPSMKRRSTAKK